MGGPILSLGDRLIGLFGHEPVARMNPPVDPVVG